MNTPSSYASYLKSDVRCRMAALAFEKMLDEIEKRTGGEWRLEKIWHGMTGDVRSFKISSWIFCLDLPVRLDPHFRLARTTPGYLLSDSDRPALFMPRMLNEHLKNLEFADGTSVIPKAEWSEVVWRYIRDSFSPSPRPPFMFPGESWYLIDRSGELKHRLFPVWAESLAEAELSLDLNLPNLTEVYGN